MSALQGTIGKFCSEKRAGSGLRIKISKQTEIYLGIVGIKVAQKILKWECIFLSWTLQCTF